MVRETVGAGVNLPAFHPPETCPPIKYPRPEPELKAKLAEATMAKMISLPVYTEWWFALF
jgi:hypothetical protein